MTLKGNEALPRFSADFPRGRVGVGALLKDAL